MPEQTNFAVYENTSNAYVMACICICGELCVAFGDDSHGMFTGACPGGHRFTVMAS